LINGFVIDCAQIDHEYQTRNGGEHSGRRGKLPGSGRPRTERRQRQTGPRPTANAVHHVVGDINALITVHSDDEISDRHQISQFIRELGPGDQHRLDQLLLVGIELAIHVGTQERIVVTTHVCQLQEKRDASAVVGTLIRLA
jgi:hypothetical protein